MAARLHVAESTSIGSRDAYALTEVVPLKNGSLREELDSDAEQAASNCVRPRQQAVCVFRVPLFLPPARSSDQHGADPTT